MPTPEIKPNPVAKPPKKDDKPSDTPSKPTSDKKKEEDNILKPQPKIIFKDGNYYLTGPNGNTRRVEIQELMKNYNVPKNAPENLKKSVSIVQDFSLVLDAYILANP